MIVSIIIFMITYFIISGWKLRFLKIGRPAGVLLGVVLMVCSKVIEPGKIFGLVNWDTILLLFGMMVIVEHLAESNFFSIIVAKIDERQLGVKRLLFLTVLGLGILAAFLVNDIVCIFFSPIMVLMIKKRNLPILPFVLGLATATNIGGIMAYTGTPQNMIIGSMSNIAYWRYFILMFPIGIVCLFINYFLLCKVYRKELNEKITDGFISVNTKPKPMLRRSVITLILVVIGFFVFKEISWVAMFGAALLLLLANRDEQALLQKIDWSLLLFFMGLFVVVGGLKESGALRIFTEMIGPHLSNNVSSMWLLGVCTVVGSNLFANVPYVLVVGETIQASGNAQSLWFTLAFASTIAGNLTLIGAVANIIVVQRVKQLKVISFLDFLRFGIPSTVACFIVGMVFLTLYFKLQII